MFVLAASVGDCCCGLRRPACRGLFSYELQISISGTETVSRHERDICTSRELVSCHRPSARLFVPGIEYAGVLGLVTPVPLAVASASG